MKRFVALVAILALLPGCAANLGFQFGNSGKSATQSSVGPEGSFSSGGVNARFGEGANLGALLGLAGLGWLFGGVPRADDQRRPPTLDSSRRINEQDCGQPVTEGTANLRCK